MPKKSYNCDIFTVYVTPKGKKNSNVPNVVNRCKNTKVQQNSIQLKDIVEFVVRNSAILKGLSQEELRKFKRLYGWTADGTQ